MMAESQRTNARFRTLLLLGCLAAVSLCTFTFWRRRQELPVTYHVPPVVHIPPLSVGPLPPSATKTPGTLGQPGSEAVKEKPNAPSTVKKWEKPKGFKIIGVIFCTCPR